MAIKFETKSDDGKPAKTETGGKAYVPEEPSAERPELPFAKPMRPDKKVRKVQ